MSTTTANVIADNNQNFSLNGEWLIQCLVYKATSTTSNNSFVYYGTSVGEFKTRYNNHTKSFRHRECMKETELSKPVWKLKDHCLDNNLSSEIHKKVSPCQCVSKRCDLCLIIYADPDTLLNKRTELISRCRHRNKFLLANNCRGMVAYGNCHLLFCYWLSFMDCIHENQLILSHDKYLQITSC